MEEIWKDINGLEGFYQISNMGAVRSYDRHVNYRDTKLRYVKGRIMKQHLACGYYYIHLQSPTFSKKVKIHRLVATAFIQNLENKPVVNHINGIKTDNRVQNLEWATIKENTQHAVNTGLLSKPKGSNNGMAKVTESMAWDIYGNRFIVPIKEMSKKYGLSRTAIGRILRGDSWNHVTGLPKRMLGEKGRILEGKNPYNHFTRKFVDCRKKYTA